MKVAYVADDGTLFYNEEECRKYEHRNCLPHGVTTYQLDFSPNDSPECAIYILVEEFLSDDEVEAVKNWLRQSGDYETSGSDSFDGCKGLYIWDYEAEIYTCIPAGEFDRYENAIKFARTFFA